MTDPTLTDREDGKSRNGEVHLSDFDRGVVETLGGVVIDSSYYLTQVPGVAAPPNKPGIPINFAFSEDTTEAYVLPSVVITRQELSPALNRFHPGKNQYRVPSPGALPVVVERGGKTFTGWNTMAFRPAPIPYDIGYEIMILAYRRGVPRRAAANALLEYVMRMYQPHTGVDVYDSLGDRRVYFATAEAPSPLDDVTSIAERVIGWNMSLRVEAELDLNGEISVKTVQTMATNMKVIANGRVL